jgi:hypothetical protein
MSWRLLAMLPTSALTRISMEDVEKYINPNKQYINPNRKQAAPAAAPGDNNP